MIAPNDEMLIFALLKLFPSTITKQSESRNFITKGMVKINGTIVNDERFELNNGDIVEIGKNFKKLKYYEQHFTRTTRQETH